MRVLTFQPQFHDQIRSGRKTSTIRDKARCKPGDELSLRRWIGKPYKPPGQELLIPNQICTTVTTVWMVIDHQGRFTMATASAGLLTAKDEMRLARAEGFPTAHVMRQWFIKAKKIRFGKPYEGSQIEWNYSP